MDKGQIIANLRMTKKMSQIELAKALNVSPSTIGMWETNQRAIKDDQLKKIATFFGVSSDYLLGLSDKPLKNQTSLPALTTPVKVYGAIHAGGPMWAEQNVIGEVTVTEKIKKDYGIENLFALIVKGQSMNKHIPEGVVAIFAKDMNIENGDIVAVLIDGQDATIKQYKETSMAVMFVPQSFDESFNPIVIPKQGEQDFRILGKMVYFVSGDYI
ncbi:MAG: XRE family transcriptional regulator [Liquorilactobacillus nagelii]|uniref:LexA family protein n=1 Tax=Liquorilactobacillus satsumensis TaxID=259059 RepID=UPI0039E8F0DE